MHTHTYTHTHTHTHTNTHTLATVRMAELSITGKEADGNVTVCANLLYDESHNVSIDLTVPLTVVPDTAGNGHCELCIILSFFHFRF